MKPLYILAAIFIFGMLIAVHELGHFLAAKLSGVRVNEFSIGMGPLIFQKEKGDTQYSLRLFPVGGFCAMEGEDQEMQVVPISRIMYCNPIQYAGIDALQYLCKGKVREQEKLFELRYTLKTHCWSIFRVVY